jgi:hypothetical protein
MKNNLIKEFFKTAAEHFAGESKHHGVMSKAWEKDSEQHASHVSRAEANSAMAEKCEKCADACGKANPADFEKMFGGMDDGDRLAPTSVSVVAIPRFGAPEIRKGEVPEQFRKMVQIDDERED